MPSLFSPPSNCWRVEPAEDFAILVDADGYFAVARNAIKAACRSIFLVGWDFDASITLGHPDVDDGAPRSVGDFLLWVARQNPDLEIRLLLCNPGFFGSWAKMANIPYLLRWKWHRQITVLLDGRHPVGSIIRKSWSSTTPSCSAGVSMSRRIGGIRGVITTMSQTVGGQAVFPTVHGTISRAFVAERPRAHWVTSAG